jgi:hypothetical protein
MKSAQGFLDFKSKKTLRLGLLLVSSLAILAASIVVYSNVVYEKTVNIGGTNVSTGSAPMGVSSWAIPILVFSAAGITLSIFYFLREAVKHVHLGNGSEQTRSVPTSSDTREGWESPRNYLDQSKPVVSTAD